MKLTSYPLSLFFICLAFFSVGSSGIAQSKFEFTKPEKLESVNSPSEEGMPLLSPDGNVLYFVRSLHEGNLGGIMGGQDIWYSSKESGKWSKPANDLGKFNDELNNAISGISSDGKTLFLKGTYSKKENLAIGASYSSTSENGWSRPKPLNIPGFSIRSPYYGVFVSPTEDVAIISMKGRGSLGDEDLYISRKNKNGNWSRPMHLGDRVNSAGYEISPFWDHRTNTLYYASNGLGGYGDVDIFATRPRDSTMTEWADPVNLGSTINSDGFDAYFSIYEGGEVYFASNRGSGLSDIFHTTMVGYRAPSKEEDQDVFADGDEQFNGMFEYNKLPASRQRIYLTDEDDNILQETTTDEEGKFDFHKLSKNKNYIIRFVEEEDLSDGEIALYRITTGGRELMVEKMGASRFLYNAYALQEKDMMANQDVETNTLTGIFKYEDLPAANVSLKLLDEEDNVIQETITDGKGRFEFRKLDPEKEYRVLLLGEHDKSQGPHLFLFNQKSGRYQEAGKVDDNTFTFSTLAMENGGIGLVEEKDSLGMTGVYKYKALPAENARLRLFDENDNFIQEVYTDRLGGFNFKALGPDKNYYILADETDQSNAARLYLFNVKSGQLDELTEDKNGFTFTTLALDDGRIGLVEAKDESKMVGTFKYENLPASGIKLKLVDENDNVIQETITDKLGNFDFQKLDPDKQYRVLVDEEDGSIPKNAQMLIRGENGKMEEIDRLSINSFAFSTLDLEDTKVNLVDEMDNSKGLEGVFEADGKPVSDVKLNLLDENGNIVETVTTDESGNFNFKKLDPDKNYMIVLDENDASKIDDADLYLEDDRKMEKVEQGGSRGFAYRALGNDKDDLAREEPKPKPKKIQPIKGQHVVYFKFNGIYLSKEDEARLRRTLLRDLKKNPSATVQVEGHTDEVGLGHINQRLSEMRAEAVKRFLIIHGIEASRITARGQGEQNPIADNSTLEGRKKNRRAEIIVSLK